MTNFSLVQDNDGLSLVLTYNDGTVQTVSDSHVRFPELKNYVLASLDGSPLEETRLRELADLVLQAGQQLSYVSPRVRFDKSGLYFDGDLVNSTLAEHILRLLKEDNGGWRPFVNFLEKLYTNPSEQSRESLYSWIAGRMQGGKITITQDGDFLAYKGVQSRADGTPESVFRGKAIVNGQVVEGHIPNVVGSILEMPRSEVDANTFVGCSTGLHVGTWNYAKDWARGAMLTIKVNPRDVVSVPNDSETQKMRVCRYEVLNVTDVEYTAPTYYEPSEDDSEYYDEDADDYDEGTVCGWCADRLDATEVEYREGRELCSDCAYDYDFDYEMAYEEEDDDEQR